MNRADIAPCPCPACNGRLVTKYIRRNHMKAFVALNSEREVDSPDGNFGSSTNAKDVLKKQVVSEEVDTIRDTIINDQDNSDSNYEASIGEDTCVDTDCEEDLLQIPPVGPEKVEEQEANEDDDVKDDGDSGCNFFEVCFAACACSGGSRTS